MGVEDFVAGSLGIWTGGAFQVLYVSTGEALLRGGVRGGEPKI